MASSPFPNQPIGVPKPGDVIYVDTDLYVWHGADDFRGGKATVSAVRVQGTSVGVEIAENPGTVYTWAFLAPKQAELAARYGDQWAHPDPDLRPEYNEDRWDDEGEEHEADRGDR